MEEASQAAIAVIQNAQTVMRDELTERFYGHYDLSDLEQAMGHFSKAGSDEPLSQLPPLQHWAMGAPGIEPGTSRV